MLCFILAFVLGVLFIIAIQALLIIVLFNRLLLKSSSSINNCTSLLDRHHESLAFAINKSGVVWVLEPPIIKESKYVSPIKKHAKIKDHMLILTDLDASKVAITLVGCTILSVSATSLASRKWAKRYPIKIENRNSVIYKGSRTCYIYLETSWEKESWCKAIRLASSVDKERVDWYARLTKEFQDYLTSLNSGYPLFMKPSLGFSHKLSGTSNKVDGPSSKVRLFLKKLAKKTPKNGMENKGSGISLIHEEKKSSEKLHSVQEEPSLSKSTEKVTSTLKDEGKASVFNYSGNRSFSVLSDADSEEKFGIDEGTLCWNLLVSRFFFDLNRNSELKSTIHSLIQRTLSNMRTPSYIGGITCTGLDLGSLPPYIHSMRVIPMDMNEVWAMELDIEYSGGAIMDIETRLEVREAEFQKGVVDTSLESNSVGEATSDILEGFEYLGKQLKLSGDELGKIDKRDEGDSKHGGTKNLRSNSGKSTAVPRWKAIINSVANQVSQVPLSLKIRVASIRGTARLHIKPPPSDRLWFAFTSMPEIDFNLESSVGDHKITNTHIALLLGSRLKTAIRDTLVLPNSDSVYIPWMLAEKDDWAPRNVAPFIWVKQEPVSEHPTTSVSNIEENHEQLKNFEHKLTEDLGSSSMKQESKQDLTTPLLSNSESQNFDLEPFGVTRREIPVVEDLNPKKGGRKARMLDLGKKMSEKLEEKRRNIEEKSRNIVEKMRGPT